jgi:hypothetical protein
MIGSRTQTSRRWAIKGLLEIDGLVVRVMKVIRVIRFIRVIRVIRVIRLLGSLGL